MRRRILVAWCLILAAGWRGDGTAQFPGAHPPDRLAADGATWSTTLPGWGNASPVPFAGAICMTAEPTHVVCLDAKRGTPRWTADNDRLHTLPAEEQPAMAAKIATLPSLQARVRDGLSDLSRLRREARKAQGDPAVQARLAALSAELDTVAAERDALRLWTTPPELDLIGYASSTPLATDDTLYAMTGNGVLSAFGTDGTRRWSRWLGAAVQPMRGYDYGSVTSPQLAGGVLVVGHAHLQGLDPSTGEVLWTDPAPWNHYGTPAVAQVDGLTVLATPDGRILRASDGEQLAEGLADIYFLGPIAQGDQIWWVGGKGHRGDLASNRAVSWRLQRQGDRVAAQQVFDRPLPQVERVYASPLLVGQRLFCLTIDNTLSVLDRNSGQLLGQTSLKPALDPTGFKDPIAYANPSLAGDRIHFGFEKGVFVTVSVADEPVVLEVSTLPEPSRATPWFDGNTQWVRTLTKLWRFERSAL